MKYQLFRCGFDNRSFKAHFHTTYSIGFILRGVHNIKIENKNFSIKQGSIKIVNPYEIHIANGKWEYINLMPKIKDLQSIITDIYEKEHKIRFDNEINDKNIVFLFKKLINSSEKLEKDENFIIFFSTLIKKHYSKSIKNFHYNINPSIEFIHSYFLKDITIENIAKASNLSKYHFIRIFSKQTGITPYKYVLNLRLEYARELIKESYPLCEIAQITNFSDQSHFIKAFKNHFGFTPVEFRKYLM